MITAPISYQGGKTRIAAAIVDRLAPIPDQPFYDLCCGCGAISIELVNHGFDPKSMVMLDKGPWGLFWEAVGQGSFDLKCFERYCRAVPEPAKIAQHMAVLAAQPASQDTLYVFLLLQAAAFGGKAIWIKNNRWMNATFRNYWLPTATSSRRSPVNPMMPMPGTLFTRVESVCQSMAGVQGRCLDIHDLTPKGGTVYIDPPYAGTTGYGHSFDVLKYAQSIGRCYVSEGRPLSSAAWLIAGARTKGGISGNRKAANEEWLSLLN